MSKKVLIVGAGVAGCSCAYFLRKKGYDVTLLEKNGFLGGLSATHYYNGHPYEFGPHVWFWPHDNINNVIRELTDNRIYDVDRKLYSFTGEGLYRYPIHFSNIEEMPDHEKIYEELKEHRGDDWKLKPETLPVIGECKFSEYFEAAIGGTLYSRFMKEYTNKMWGIPGDVLDTKMVWADRIKNKYEGVKAYDPIKFKDHFLGAGQPNWYPMDGWNVVWEKMVEGCLVKKNTELKKIGHDKKGFFIKAAEDKKEEKYYTEEYHAVINTIHSDELWGDYVLPANGRLIIPFFLPRLDWAFPEGAESIHFSDDTALTRTTEMKRITRHKSEDTLIVLEVPVTEKSLDAFPGNVIKPEHYHPRCYNHQTDEARKTHQEYLNKGAKIENLFHCGRHAEFKYWGMPEVVDSAFRLIKEKF